MASQERSRRSGSATRCEPERQLGQHRLWRHHCPPWASLPSPAGLAVASAWAALTMVVMALLPATTAIAAATPPPLAFSFTSAHYDAVAWGHTAKFTQTCCDFSHVVARPRRLHAGIPTPSTGSRALSARMFILWNQMVLLREPPSSTGHSPRGNARGVIHILRRPCAAFERAVAWLGLATLFPSGSCPVALLAQRALTQIGHVPVGGRRHL